MDFREHGKHRELLPQTEMARLRWVRGAEPTVSRAQSAIDAYPSVVRGADGAGPRRRVGKLPSARRIQFTFTNDGEPRRAAQRSIGRLRPRGKLLACGALPARSFQLGAVAPELVAADVAWQRRCCHRRPVGSAGPLRRRRVFSAPS